MRFLLCRVKLACTRPDANLPFLTRRPGGRNRPPVRRVPALVPQVPPSRVPRLDRVLGLFPDRSRALGVDARPRSSSRRARPCSPWSWPSWPTFLSAARRLALPPGAARVAARRDALGRADPGARLVAVLEPAGTGGGLGRPDLVPARRGLRGHGVRLRHDPRLARRPRHPLGVFPALGGRAGDPRLRVPALPRRFGDAGAPPVRLLPRDVPGDDDRRRHHHPALRSEPGAAAAEMQQLVESDSQAQGNGHPRPADRASTTGTTSTTSSAASWPGPAATGRRSRSC